MILPSTLSQWLLSCPVTAAQAAEIADAADATGDVRTVMWAALAEAIQRAGSAQFGCAMESLDDARRAMSAVQDEMAEDDDPAYGEGRAEQQLKRV